MFFFSFIVCQLSKTGTLIHLLPVGGGGGGGAETLQNRLYSWYEQILNFKLQLEVVETIHTYFARLTNL